MGRMHNMLSLIIISLGFSKVPCWGKSSLCRVNEKKPDGCITDKAKALETWTTVEEFDRCAPYFMPNVSRNYYLEAAGRCVSFTENLAAYQRLRIHPKMLRDVSNINMRVTVLNHTISMPIAASPTALQKLASQQGELDTVRAVYKERTLMILSSYSSTLLEDVADAEPRALKWMQMYIFADRDYTVNLIQRAEAKDYKAVVVTVDSPIQESVSSRESIFGNNPANATYVNLLVLNGKPPNPDNPSLTFKDISWLKRTTKLPIVVKGILTPGDAVQVILRGASAILVSNHGGRALDYVPATINVLRDIVDAVKHRCPWAEVYIDGGIRNGFDVFKALAWGARAVFIGRPVAWGLATGGESGVSKIFSMLRTEFNQTMILAGCRTLKDIERTMVTEGHDCAIGKA